MKKLILILLLGIGLNAEAQQIQRDKVLHFGVGATIGGVTSYVCQTTNLTHNKFQTLIVCVGTSTLAAVGKEIYDLNVKKTFINNRDILWTSIGGIVGGISVSYTIPVKKTLPTPTF